MKLTIDHDFIDRNGVNRAKLIARNEAGTILHSDTITLESAMGRTRFIKRLRELDGSINAGEVERDIQSLIDIPRESKSDKPEDTGPDHRALLDEMPKDVRAEADAMLENPKILELVSRDIASLGVAGERILAIVVFLIALSRLLLKPLAGIVQGPTSSGKSYTIERVAEAIPPEAKWLAQQLSPAALYHMPPGSLQNKFIVAGERSRREDDGQAEATRALREMLSSGVLTKLIAGKDENGQITTEHIIQQGPIAYIESTTQTRIFDEDLNRCILLATDERTEQTGRIINAQALRYQYGPDAEREKIIQRHYALQRMVTLETAPVVVPFADKLAEEFPKERTEARRAFGQVLSMVEAIATLHVRHRDCDANGCIRAVAADYDIARILLGPSMSRALGGGISDGAKRFWERRAAWIKGETFTSTQAFKVEKYSDRAVRGWLVELADRGFLTVVDARRGMATVYRQSDDPPDLQTMSALPMTEDVCNGVFSSSILPTAIKANSTNDLTRKCSGIPTTSDRSGLQGSEGSEQPGNPAAFLLKEDEENELVEVGSSEASFDPNKE